MMAYLTMARGVVCDLGESNDRSLARVRGVFIKHPRLIFDN